LPTSIFNLKTNLPKEMNLKILKKPDFSQFRKNLIFRPVNLRKKFMVSVP